MRTSNHQGRGFVAIAVEGDTHTDEPGSGNLTSRAALFLLSVDCFFSLSYAWAGHWFVCVCLLFISYPPIATIPGEWMLNRQELDGIRGIYWMKVPAPAPPNHQGLYKAGAGDGAGPRPRALRLRLRLRLTKPKKKGKGTKKGGTCSSHRCTHKNTMPIQLHHCRPS